MCLACVAQWLSEDLGGERGWRGIPSSVLCLCFEMPERHPLDHTNKQFNIVGLEHRSEFWAGWRSHLCLGDILCQESEWDNPEWWRFLRASPFKWHMGGEIEYVNNLIFFWDTLVCSLALPFQDPWVVCFVLFFWKVPDSTHAGNLLCGLFLLPRICVVVERGTSPTP